MKVVPRVDELCALMLCALSDVALEVGADGNSRVVPAQPLRWPRAKWTSSPAFA